jgi:hypothetical protein
MLELSSGTCLWRSFRSSFGLVVFRRFPTRRIKNHPEDRSEPRDLLQGLFPTDLFLEFLEIELPILIRHLVADFHGTPW